METPLQVHLRNLSTSQLMTVLRSYSLTNQGSSQLYSKAAVFTMKRLHSLQPEQQAEVCYYFARAKQPNARLFNSVQHYFMRDIRKFPPKSVAYLSYSFTSTGSQDFYRTISEVFKANYSDFTVETGLLLLTGLSAHSPLDSGLYPALEAWVSALPPPPQTLLVQLIHVLLRLHVDSALVTSLENQLVFEEMDLKTIEHFLGCCVSFGREINEKVVNSLENVLESEPNDYVTVSKLIYTVKLAPNHGDFMSIIHSFLYKTLGSMSASEFALIASSLLHTKSLNSVLISLLDAYFTTHKFGVSDVLRVLLAAGSDKAHVTSLVPQITEIVKGHVCTSSEFVLLVSLLVRLDIQEDQVWEEVCREATVVKLEDAEQYMQLVAVLRTVKTVDTTAALQAVARLYEAQ